MAGDLTLLRAIGRAKRQLLRQERNAELLRLWHRRAMKLRRQSEQAVRDQQPDWPRVYTAFVEASDQELQLQRLMFGRQE